MSAEIPLARHLSIVLRHHYATMNEQVRPLGLFVAQVPILLRLSAGQNVTQESLARHFHFDKGAVARAARGLEEAGLIRRETDPSDRRAVRLFLTRAGEALVPEIRRIEREWEARVLADLRPDERDAFCSLLGRVAASCLDGRDCRE
ncbi:MAG TPA: MarR family transcriptional regulator [Methanoregulaceae archaeon]|nr:MarR family transcriptional regulator [Methanoregulaceae archaeon]